MVSSGWGSWRRRSFSGEHGLNFEDSGFYFGVEARFDAGDEVVEAEGAGNDSGGVAKDTQDISELGEGGV